MAQGIFSEELPSLPKLLSLDAMRVDFCSQSEVDNISKYLWIEQPALIQELTECEMIQDILLSRTGHHTKICEWILVHLIDEAPNNIAIPKTALGRLDLLYEISKRIREAINAPKIDIIGNSLAETRKGPFPETISLPMSKQLIANKDIPQDIIDVTILTAYMDSPELFYDFAEQKKLLIFSYEIKAALGKKIWDLKPEEQKNNGAFVGLVMQEINTILDHMCGFKKAMKDKGYIV